MKKAVLLSLVCAFVVFNSFAQVASYTFNQTSGTYTEITGGTILGDAGSDEQLFVNPSVPLGDTTTSGVGLPIGFNFRFNGNIFDVFAISTNGWISLGQSSQTPAVNMNSSTYQSPVSATSTAPAILQNRISAFGRNLAGQTGSVLSFATTGTAPNRVLVVQWKGYRRNNTSTGENLNLQIRLNETTNTVVITYGTFTYTGSNSTVQVGLRGEANTDFNNRLSTNNWSATTAGTSNTSSITISSATYPSSGLTFTYNEPVTYQYDAGITAINTPVTPVSLGNNNIGVTIKNFGTDNLTGATIEWSVNGLLQAPFTFTHTGLSQNSVVVIDSVGVYNFSAVGSCVIRAWTSLPNLNIDVNTVNDTISKTVYVQGYAPLPFYESFNSTWLNYMSTRDVPSVYWSNIPSTGNSSWRRNDDGSSASWTSTTNGAYTPTGVGTGSTLYSARFHSRSATANSTGELNAYVDFSTAGSKILKFWHINTAGTDTLSVYISNNGGVTFNLLQAFATATTWTQRTVFLGSSTAPNTIVRFQVKNLTTGTGTTDVGIDSVEINLLSLNDAGISVINTPSTPVILGVNPVSVTIRNYGAAVLTDASIHWSVNNVAQLSYTYNNSGLATGLTDGPLVLGNYNFANPGFYVIKAWSSLPNGSADADNSNDTIIKSVYVQNYAAIPFTEEFDNIWVNKNDTSDVPSVYWTNNPAYGNNSWRRDDDSLTAPWTEGGSGVYAPSGANGTVHSARFHTWYASNNTKGTMDLFLNLSPVGSKILDFWYINEDGNDSLSVFLSTDNGLTFNLVQKFLTTVTWSQYIINIGATTSDACIVRFKASSDYGYSDIGIDQVQVYMQPSDDMVAVEWVTPVSGCGLTNAEHVTVKVLNAGLIPQNHIPVKYSIDGGASFVGPDTIAGPINPGDTVTFTFTGTSDFSVAGIHNCLFVVCLSGDAIAMNDTAFMDFYTIQEIDYFPFLENFDGRPSDYLMLSANEDAGIYYDAIGTQGSTGLVFTGKTTNGWPSGTTSAVTAWNNTSHQADALTCDIDASGVSALNMKFDLQQTTSSNNNLTYSWYAVVVNGTDTLTHGMGNKFFNPTSTNDIYTSKLFDLSAYAGSNFNIKFISSCRRDDVNSTTGIGDNVYMDNLQIYVPPTINDLGQDTSICQGQSITFDAGAGTGYSYIWIELTSGDTLGTSQTLITSITGDYYVLVTDASGFTASDEISLSILNPPAAMAGADITIQAGTNTMLQGGTGPYTYSWSPASLLTDASLQNPFTSLLSASTIFTLTVIDTITGCTGTDEVIVFVSGGPLSVLASSDTSLICPGSCASLMALPSGGSGTFIYSWSSTPAGFISAAADPVVCPFENTTYTITVTDLTEIAVASVSIVIQALPTVELGNDTTLCNGETLTLNAGSAATYQWSTGANTSSIVIDSTYAVGGVALVWVTATNALGCSITDTIAINYISCAGMNDYKSNESISMHPNPTRGITNITLKGFSGADINVYNALGIVVYAEKVEANNGYYSKEFNFSYLPKGLYLIRISNENKSRVSKLIIQ